MLVLSRSRWGHTGRMTATIKIARSRPSIRAALAELSPAECQRFETEFQQAAQQAGEQVDLTPLDSVLDRWAGRATILANPLSEQEQELLARFRDGDDRGSYVRDGDGWRQL